MFALCLSKLLISSTLYIYIIYIVWKNKYLLGKKTASEASNSSPAMMLAPANNPADARQSHYLGKCPVGSDATSGS